jgi:Flp pilus assembly protein TadD
VKSRKKANLVITKMKKILILIALLSSTLLSQNADVLREDALRQMESGKYGEAIDVLNRYISAKPQNAEGYNLRGLAYEKRGMYEMAVYNFRSAQKLAPRNQDISLNLSRATQTWYKMLYSKIEGHNREIAINPNTPVNYLEIGKSYKNLGNWAEAEKWYDEYLKREEASPDEIIRYTEILAKNNHVSKGEPILKSYVEQYPDDHRLWSRYGYFTMWLGKKKIAIDAFEHSLVIKPYFQEAMDGLDMAKGKGYVFTVNDTSYRYSKKEGMVSRAPKFEYPIDRFYRLLKKNPSDNETRLKLVKELIKAGRHEEAFFELEILASDSKEKGKYDSFITDVKSKRDSLIAVRVKSYINKIAKNSKDKESVTRLAIHYAGIQDYDNALLVLSTYLSKVPEKDAPDLRFMYARYAAWDYRFRESLDQLEILLKYYPDNTEYQLLRAQIAVWTDQELNKADFYLGEVLKKNPDNFPALLSSASLKIKQQEFAAAKLYLDRASGIDPENKDLEALQSSYEFNRESYELYRILYSARELVEKNDCAGALIKYDEYLSKVSAPSRLEKIEYASIFICLGENKRAVEVYNQLLEEDYDYDIALFRAKAYLWSGDSIAALNEFTKLVNERPDDFDANFFYGVALASNHEYGDAEDVYDRLLEETTDTARIKMLTEAKSWLPRSRLFGSFPSYLALSPQVGFYDDNQAFTLSNMGLKLEFGVTKFLSAGASYSRVNLESEANQRNMNSFKGNLYLRFSEKLQLAAGIGSMKTKDISSKGIYDVMLKYDVQDQLSAYFYYEKNDARMILYSPFIIDTSMNTNLWKAGFTYKTKSGIRSSGHLTYLGISDKNEGNDFLVRIGKAFYRDFALGYEYQYLDYSRKTPLYWSPDNFDSHSLWGDWLVLEDKNDNVKINFGGRLGYITRGDFVIREITGDLSYKPLPYFVLAGKLTAGSTYRFDTSYNYVSAVISAYWNIY